MSFSSIDIMCRLWGLCIVLPVEYVFGCWLLKLISTGKHLRNRIYTFKVCHISATVLRPDHSARRDSTQLVELSRIGRYDHFTDPTQLNSTGSRVFVSFCQFWTFQLSWVELSRVVGVSIAPDPTQLDEADWLSVVTQFSIPMSLFHC